jgi:hypothetical protein
LLSVVGSCLAAQTETNVGICLGEGLRVRSAPRLSGDISTKLAKGEEVFILGESLQPETINGLTARWYRVVNYNGEVGWAFGGYLDTTHVNREMYFINPSEAANTKIVEEWGDAGLYSIAVGTAEESPPGWSTAFLLFHKPGGGAAQIVNAELGGSYLDEIWRDISVDCRDLFGDRRVEILLHSGEGTSDGGNYGTRVYSLFPGSEHYEIVGRYISGWNDHGDIVRTSLDLIEGPEAVTENGVRKMKLVYSSNDRIVESYREDGSPILAEHSRVWEEIYELKDGKLHLSRTKDISASKETLSTVGDHRYQ